MFTTGVLCTVCGAQVYLTYLKVKSYQYMYNDWDHNSFNTLAILFKVYVLLQCCFLLSDSEMILIIAVMPVHSPDTWTPPDWHYSHRCIMVNRSISLTEGSQYEYIKCVVVGDSAVGKTCLVCDWACGTQYTLDRLVKTPVSTVWAIDHYRNDKEVMATRQLLLLDNYCSILLLF